MSFLYLITLYKTYFIVKEVDSVLVQPERQGLEEGNVVGHHLLVGEIELVHDNRIDVVVRQ